MKLESLNNSKYSLTPEKMGELVGGQKVIKSSSGGTYRLGVSQTVTCHHDVKIFANEKDAQTGYIEAIEFYGGDGKLIGRA